MIGTHFKNRPVHFFDDGEPGQSLKSFATPIGQIATPVCFDCDYAQVARELVVDGAELIIAPSMDAEAWTERQHEQHGQLSVTALRRMVAGSRSPQPPASRKLSILPRTCSIDMD